MWQWPCVPANARNKRACDRRRFGRRLPDCAARTTFARAPVQRRSNPFDYRVHAAYASSDSANATRSGNHRKSALVRRLGNRRLLISSGFPGHAMNAESPNHYRSSSFRFREYEGAKKVWKEVAHDVGCVYGFDCGARVFAVRHGNFPIRNRGSGVRASSRARPKTESRARRRTATAYSAAIAISSASIIASKRTADTL